MIISLKIILFSYILKNFINDVVYNKSALSASTDPYSLILEVLLMYFEKTRDCSR